MKLTPQQLEASQGTDEPSAHIGRKWRTRLSCVDERVRAAGADDEQSNAGAKPVLLDWNEKP